MGKLARFAAAALGALALALVFSSCRIDHYALPSGYEPKAELPAELAARFDYPRAPFLEGTPKFDFLDETETYRRWRGRYAWRNPYEDGGLPRTVVYFRFYETKKVEGRRPVILMMPILAGSSYPEMGALGPIFTEAGYHAFFVEREEHLLHPPTRKGKDLERILRKSIANIRKTIDYIVTRDDVDAARLGSIGISLGAMGDVVLAALERERLRAHVFVMGGAHLPQIILESKEGLVKRFRNGRMRSDGLTEEDLRAELERTMVSDPAVFAPYVDARTVLQFISRLDNKVPSPRQWELWEALGRPEAYTMPIGHYTSIFYADFAKRHTLAFFHRRFYGTDAEPEPEPVPVPEPPTTARVATGATAPHETARKTAP